MGVVAVVGVGTVGGAVAARLCAAGRDDVALCVRTPFEALVVEGPEGILRATPRIVTTPDAVQPVTWVLLATKAYQTAGAADWLRALATSQTTVAILQNGVEHEEHVAPYADGATLLPVVVDCPAVRVAPGRIVQRAPAQLIVPATEAGRHLIPEGRFPLRPEVYAHPGAHDDCPENRIPAFQRAIQLGADGVELDVRLTSDGLPIIYHYFYLHEYTSGSASVFAHPLEAVRQLRVDARQGKPSRDYAIPTLHEALGAIAGHIGLEIEIKGPEPEAVEAVADVLRDFEQHWPTIAITSFEPAIPRAIKERCSPIPTCLLFPKSESWMGSDVVAYAAIHRSRLAGAGAVHLHPTQLSRHVVETVRRQGIEIHSWEVNDRSSLEKMLEFKIPRFDTDVASEALRIIEELAT
jgi:glycerophosphoryl diester phosphodiesterase